MIVDRGTLDKIVAETISAHEQRLDRAEDLPLPRRGRRIKKRPRTAIISRAAKAAIEHKFWGCKT